MWWVSYWRQRHLKLPGGKMGKWRRRKQYHNGRWRRRDCVVGEVGNPLLLRAPAAAAALAMAEMGFRFNWKGMQICHLTYNATEKWF